MTNDIRRWMEEYEKHLQAVQHSATVRSLSQSGGRLSSLKKIQNNIPIYLSKLIKVFWTQNPSQREALVRPYLKALNTTKLVCDDVFIEARHEALIQKNQPELNLINNKYQETIIEWIKGSPLLNPTTNQRNDKFIPQIKNLLLVPFLRSMTGHDFEGLGPPTFFQRAKRAVLADIKRIKAARSGNGLSLETEHMLGLIFLRAQMELKQRWEIDITTHSQVGGWYTAAQSSINVIRNDILDIFASEIRTALVINKDQETAHRFLKLHRSYLREVATLFSIRTYETSVLFTFFDKQNKEGKFAFEDEVIGVNKITEKISSYLGQPDPDNQDRAALSVDTVRTRQTELNGHEVKVFGLITGQWLRSERTKDRIKLGPINLQGYQSNKKDHRVFAEGKLILNNGVLEIADATITPHLFAYVANVGFFLRSEPSDSDQPLELTPEWRRVGQGLELEAHRELEKKSVPDTFAGQQQLVIDLLMHDEVRQAVENHFRTGNGRSKKSKEQWKKFSIIDLNDTEIRTLAWEALFQKFRKENKKTAFQRLLNLMNQYLKYYTRHTYFNVRDKDPNYLNSKWPTDLTGSEFFDCGVYAIRVAYDIYKAVHASSVKVEFRFLTFLNHICLIGYIDGDSFLVNNDRIYFPEPLPRSVHQVDPKLIAGFSWAEKAYATVYDIDFAIFLAVIPSLVVTTGDSDSSFKQKIWNAYKNSLFWGLRNDRAAPQSSNTPSYFDDIKTFHTGSLRLHGLLKKIREKNVASTSEEMVEATKLALDLYDLADRLAHYDNFVAEKKVNHDAAIGFGSRLRLGKNEKPTLPMYDIVDILKKKQGLSPLQKQLVSKKVRSEHVSDLTTAFSLKQPAGKP